MLLRARFGTVLSLVIADHETGVNDARDPAQKRKQKAQQKAEHAARQQNCDRWQDDTEEVAKCFQSL